MNPTLGRSSTAHTPKQGPEFPVFGLSWTLQISAREQPLANRCCGIEEETEDYLPSKYLAERVRFHALQAFGHKHDLAEIPCAWEMVCAPEHNTEMVSCEAVAWGGRECCGLLPCKVSG